MRGNGADRHNLFLENPFWEDAAVPSASLKPVPVGTSPFCSDAAQGIIAFMPPAPGATKAVGMVPDELKSEPRSKGLTTPRKKKPKELAVITECCTGCAGSPACVEYCPVEDCMFWVADEDSTPFGRIAVDPILCIGCKKCLSKGPDGCFLDGCPWDAIAMVDTAEVEKEVGAMAI
jgi:ferredoxin